MKEKKYILFDLDGTLTDPMEGICRSVAHALEHFGIHEDYRDLTSFIGPPLREEFRKQYGFTEEEAKEAVKVFREYFVPKGIFENEIYPGIAGMLEELKEKGRKLAVATSKPEELAVVVLKHFEIYDYFDVVSGSNMDETGTRKSEVITKALQRLRAEDKEEIIMVGDRSYDAAGAAELGLQCIGVLYGYGSKEEFAASGAAYLAESVEELRKLLLEI